MWEVRFAQLAEEGIAVEPTAMPEHPQPGIDLDHAWDYHHTEQVYLRGAGSFWLVWHMERPVGHVGRQDVSSAIELRRMYVRASRRRLGVGTKLVEALIAHTHAQAVRAIKLWTAVNVPGRQFYPTLGFRETEGPGPEFDQIHFPVDITTDQIRMRLDV